MCIFHVSLHDAVCFQNASHSVIHCCHIRSCANHLRYQQVKCMWLVGG